MRGPMTAAGTTKPKISGQENHAHEIAEQQDLPRQDRGVLQYAAQDQSALDQRARRVGQCVEIDLVAWRIALCDHAQPLAKTRAPGQHAFRVQLAHVLAEQLILVGERGGKAAGMRLRQVSQHLSEELEPNEEAVQRVFIKSVAAPENIFEQLAILREIAQQQALGEFALVPEMIKKAALRNAGRRDQLLNRGGGEAFGEHRAFRELKQTLARVAALAWDIFEHSGLYHEYS